MCNSSIICASPTTNRDFQLETLRFDIVGFVWGVFVTFHRHLAEKVFIFSKHLHSKSWLGTNQKTQQTKAVAVGPAGLQGPKQDGPNHGLQLNIGCTPGWRLMVFSKMFAWFAWLFCQEDNSCPGASQDVEKGYFTVYVTWNPHPECCCGFFNLMGACKDIMFVLWDICLGIFVRSSRFFTWVDITH